MSNKHLFAVVHETDDMIQCYGVYSDYHRAVGRLVCWMTDSEDEWIQDGYDCTGKADFEELEMETGFVWFREFKKGSTVINDRWYLLITETDIDE